MDATNIEVVSFQIDKRIIIGLGSAALLAFIGMFVVFGSGSSGKMRLSSSNSSNIPQLSQNIAKNALKAGNGLDAGASHELEGLQAQFAKEVAAFPSAALSSKSGQAFSAGWTDMSASITKIVTFYRSYPTFSDSIQGLQKQLIGLQKSQEALVAQLLTELHPTDAVAVITRQSWLAERLLGHLQALLQEPTAARVDRFGKDLQLFGQIVQALGQGDAKLQIAPLTEQPDLHALAEIKKQFQALDTDSKAVVEGANAFAEAHLAADSIFKHSQSLLEQMPAVAVEGGGSSKGRGSLWLGYALGLIGLGLLGVLGVLLYRDMQKNFAQTALQHKANRAAVWRLLDELSTLAEGDLTIQATVSDDITGSIAESVNFAIGALRQLVTTIDKTAQGVSASAEEAQGVARELADASANQAREIVGASTAINEIALSIEAVSANAQKSSEVAINSVEIAQMGAKVVRDNMQGMDRIRAQIQETSKKITQLSDSSQEIGNIISLIDDIADQTNILALNAAIQAAMAGEAGRGFAVVADEVQRLAEKSGQATKQIEDLVRNIQKNTQDTIASMNEATGEVVEGTKLAHDAANALEKIEMVSKQLADHIQNISNAAQEQVSGSVKASSTMNVIQEITTQTALGSSAAATSIGKLAQMSQELKNSVAGFKLPGSAAPAPKKKEEVVA